jgi:hypothetical protein
LSRQQGAKDHNIAVEDTVSTDSMGFKSISKIREAAVLKSDGSHNEETTPWCNRDLVP